jgi:hypothetical protein
MSVLQATASLKGARLLSSSFGPRGVAMVDERGTTRSIGWLALGLFIAGLLLPFVSYAILISRLLGLSPQLALNVAAGIGAVCELLALILGVIGWRHLPAKVAAIGAGVVIGLVFAAVALVQR